MRGTPRDAPGSCRDRRGGKTPPRRRRRRPPASVSARRRPASRTRSCSASCGGHFVRLFAPRKYGKTSLLKRALRDGEEQEGLIPVLVDLYRVSSITDVTVRFERAYSKHLKGALRTKIEEFLQKTGIGLSLGAYGISAKLQLDPKADPLPALHALLDLPLRLGARPDEATVREQGPPAVRIGGADAPAAAGRRGHRRLRRRPVQSNQPPCGCAAWVGSA